MHTVPDERIWDQIRREAARDADGEPALAAYLHGCVLRHATLEDSRSSILAARLESPALTTMTLRDLIGAAMAAEPAIGTAGHAAERLPV